jgi:hypothetical protein
MYSEEHQEKISRIIELDLEMTRAIIKGHRPHHGDEFQAHRDELLKLRCEIFPDSIWAKKETI